jgi:hypothetical protein
MEREEPRYLHFLAPAFAPVREEDDDGAVPTEPADDTRPDETDSASHEPPGAALMARIADGLRSRGWRCDYTWATYRGHGLDARRVKRRYDLELWLADAEEGRWELSAEPRRGLFRKLFQQKPDPDEHALLRLHLDETLEDIAEVSRPSPWRRVPLGQP